MSKHATLVSTLQEIFSQPEDLMFTLLLDSSGSVKNEYETLRQLCMNLISKLKGIRVQIVQFSTEVRRECDFTSNEETLMFRLKNMTHMNGTTEMYSAFSFTKKSLSLKCDETSVPVVLMITDGDHSGQDPKPAVDDLLKLKPTPQIIGVRIGSGTNLKPLQKMLGGPVFPFNAYSSLELEIEGLLIKRPIPEPLIILTFTPSNLTLQKSSDPLVLQFHCQLDSRIESLPKGTEITFLGNAYYHSEKVKLEEEIANDKSSTGNVTLRVRAGAKFENFPEQIKFVAEVPNTEKTKYKGTISMLLGWFSSDFIFERCNHAFNILVWGAMGSGKTSLINGMLGLFTSNQLIDRPLTSYRSQTHVTKAYSRTPAITHLDKTPTPLSEALVKRLSLTFWDSWGLTSTSYKNVSLQHFLEGSVRPGTELDKPFELEPEPKPENVIHAVIMVIPIGTSEDAKLLQTLGDHIKTVLDFKLYPVVVINFLNTVKSDEDRRASYKEIVNASGLKEADCVLFDNYESEKWRNMEKDLIYWRILDQVFQQGQSKYFQTGSMVSSGPRCCTSDCTQKGKLVESPFCGGCGAKPQNPSAIRKCYTSNCKNQGKEVEEGHRFCSQCGKKPGPSGS